jgi:hypothetical protein
MMASRGMSSAGHVAYMGEIINTYKCWSEKLKERDVLEDPGVYWRMRLK